MAPEKEKELHEEVEKAFVSSLSSDEIMRSLLSRAFHAAAKKVREQKDNNVRIRLENTLYRLATRWEKLVGYPERTT